MRVSFALVALVLGVLVGWRARVWWGHRKVRQVFAEIQKDEERKRLIEEGRPPADSHGNGWTTGPKK